MKTDFLFARPSFLRGVGTVIDLRGRKIYNESETESEADSRAILSDWYTIGEDMKGALNACGQ